MAVGLVNKTWFARFPYSSGTRVAQFWPMQYKQKSTGWRSQKSYFPEKMTRPAVMSPFLFALPASFLEPGPNACSRVTLLGTLGKEPPAMNDVAETWEEGETWQQCEAASFVTSYHMR